MTKSSGDHQQHTVHHAQQHQQHYNHHPLLQHHPHHLHHHHHHHHHLPRGSAEHVHAHAHRYALQARNLVKTYKTGDLLQTTKITVLDELNINVRKGLIYGLLGPSGCGKTTLLKCLLGLITIDSGSIHIHEELKSKQGERKPFRMDLSKLGFMPQDATLYAELTIKETFYFYGKLYSLDKNKIRSREQFLIDLLDLPPTDQLVSFLSGGQMRRTSLAVTLLNEPSILILDEPTVGMDPILRKRIWNYLEDLSRKQRTTIVITTHYIEEARKADCLGFMRHGHIIEENSPEFFIHKYKQHMLEEIFYTICAREPVLHVQHNLDNHHQYHQPHHHPHHSHHQKRKHRLSASSQESAHSNDDKQADNHSDNNNKDDDDENDDVYEDEDEENEEEEGVVQFSPITHQLMRKESTSFLVSQRKLSEISEEENAENKSLSSSSTESSRRLEQFPMNFFSFFCLSRVIANIYKDVIKCKRNKKLMIVQLVVPLIQITLFCTCIGRPPLHLPVGIVNYDNSSDSSNLSEQFINAIDNRTITKKRFESMNAGMNELHAGKIWSLIVIDENFSETIWNAVFSNNLADGFDQAIHIYSDNTNHQISYAIRDALLRAIRVVVEQNMAKLHPTQTSNGDSHNNHNDSHQPATTKHTNKYPIVFEKSVYGDDEPVFTHFMAPGISLSVIFFMSVAATASNFVLERQLGLVERAYLTGTRNIEILVSQLIVYSFIMLIQVFVIFVFLFGLFKLPLRGSLILLVILSFSQGFCGLCYGLFLASIIYDQETAIQATLASFYPFLLMSGIIWPIEAQPTWLKMLSSCLPLTYASDAFRAILEKNWNMANFHVWRGFLATYAWTILFSVGFLIMFSRRRK